MGQLGSQRALDERRARAACAGRTAAILGLGTAVGRERDEERVALGEAAELLVEARPVGGHLRRDERAALRTERREPRLQLLDPLALEQRLTAEPRDGDVRQRAGRERAVEQHPDRALGDRAVLDIGVPTLGVCYGMQLMTHMLGGTLGRSGHREFGHALVRRDTAITSRMLKGMPDEMKVWASHGDFVASAPPGFAVAATSNNAPVAVMEAPERGYYALLFHPEVAHTDRGKELLRNFAFDVCGCTGDWTIASFIDEATARGRLAEASRLNWSPAQIDYAQVLTGETSPASQAEAGRLFLAAAERGDPRGQFFYARWLRDSSAGPRDPTAAAPYLERAAQSGQVDALHMLATLNRDGIGVPRNEGRAKALYEQAARQNFPASMFNLADMLRSGTEGEQARAIALYSQLACLPDERQIQPMAVARLRALRQSAACR